MPGNALVQSLVRGLDLLRLLVAAEGGMSLPEIVSAAGLKRPTAHNLLRTLASRGFVVRERGVYRPGPAIAVLAAEAVSGAFLRHAEAAVRVLAGRLPGAIVSFCEPVGTEVLVRFHLFPAQTLVQRPAGSVFSPYQTASGLAFLAHADPEQRQGVQLRHPFEVEGIGIWQTPARLEAFLAEVRARGYVLPPFCSGSTFRLAAWPVLGRDGRLRGMFGAAWQVVSGSGGDGTAAVLSALRDAAAEVTAAGV
ncbi:MAG: helix-turn-helix domain-containing protein [Lentisphaeria bacterium]|nr:helix-turn-helix domain-containing protein [Lentisphaeria bacterium]